MLCGAGFLMLFAGQFLAKTPVIRLKLLANRSYASILFIVFTVGAGVYCVSYLVPQFLSGVAGYNAAQSGGVMLIAALPAFLLMPVLPRLSATVNLRLMLILGLLVFAVSCVIDTGLTAQSGGTDFYPSQLLRGAGQMLAFMPLNQAVMAAVSSAEAGDAAGLYNMVRNLGGSVGLAALAAFIERRDAFHGEMLRESLTANAPMVQDYLGASAGSFLAQHGDPAYANLQAMAQLAAQAQQQAVVLTYSETFYVLAWALVLCVPLVFVLRTGTASPGSRQAESH
jgi:DHA2 family multidrug resistance protein